MKRLMAVLCVLCLLLAGCAGQRSEQPAAPAGSELTEDLTPNAVETAEVGERFVQAQMSFALKLFQQTAQDSAAKNLLISPLSVAPALAMTANGAAGKTQEEMLAVLGGLSMEELNSQLSSYLRGLSGEELKIANSVWIREGLTVKQSFLQTNLDHYNAQIYQAPFDASTVQEINSWVDENTDGMIPKLLERIDGSTVMYLLNALAFDAEWKEPYYSTRSRTFTAYDGAEQVAEMMFSEESQYLEDENAVGLIRDYKGGAYRFAALMPNEGVDLYDYVQALTAEGLLKTLQAPKREPVEAGLPKFSYEYESKLNDTLKAMGMPTAFDSDADFSGIAEGLFISEVRHKTLIEVTEFGTRAAAVTSVAMDESAPVIEKTVILDRPFVYFIVDAENDLPVFMGIVASVE